MQYSGAAVNVMHLTDTLEAGGLERVAVNLVNCLPRERYQLHLCTTRRDGALAGEVKSDVRRLRLERKTTLDLEGLKKLVGYLRQHRIDVLHAHGSSLFIACAAAGGWRRGGPAIIWHDHYGRYLSDERPAWLYRIAARFLSGVIAVNEPLADWSRKKLRVAADRVWFIPNFSAEARAVEDVGDLPGEEGGRIACVANLRPQKDHLTLLRAMAEVVRQKPSAHLLLVGGAGDERQHDLIRREADRLGLTDHVSFLGDRRDVFAILRASEIGVLSSVSEGLPLALIEYGMAGLPAIVTRVGQCPDVVDEGRAGILVPPAAPDLLAQSLLDLLNSPSRRRMYGERLRQRVEQLYSPRAVIDQVCRVYDQVLEGRAKK